MPLYCLWVRCLITCLFSLWKSYNFITLKFVLLPISESLAFVSRKLTMFKFQGWKLGILILTFFSEKIHKLASKKHILLFILLLCIESACLNTRHEDKALQDFIFWGTFCNKVGYLCILFLGVIGFVSELWYIYCLSVSFEEGGWKFDLFVIFSSEIQSVSYVRDLCYIICTAWNRFDSPLYPKEPPIVSLRTISSYNLRNCFPFLMAPPSNRLAIKVSNKSEVFYIW